MPSTLALQQICVATHDGVESKTYTIKLAKGERSRFEEDTVASLLVVSSLAAKCDQGKPGQNLDLRLKSSEAKAGESERLQEDIFSIGDPLEALYQGKIATVEFSGGRLISDAPRKGRTYLPGSYNPFHEGHRKMLKAACTSLGSTTEGCYELSIGNPDKGRMPIEDCRKRIQQFVDANLPILITKAPLYSDKSKLCPGSTFVIGYDTAIRLIMPKYYGGFNGMLLDLHGIHLRGCKFLVAGRIEDGSDKFLTLDDIDLPSEIREMGLFRSIPETEFRLDISSTELRNKGQGL